MISTLSELLGILADGHFHSGQSLGRQLAISRAAVWKRVQAARLAGYEVQAVTGLGYRLAEAALPAPRHEHLLEGFSLRVRQELAVLEVLDTVDSTNSRCNQLLAKSRGMVVCLARAQTAGRGRHGREWHSPAGSNFYGSVGMELPVGFAALEGLSLGLGVRVLEVLQDLGAQGLGLKWPNDLVTLTGQKLGGILIEVQGEPQGPCQVVLGLGLNVRLSPAERSRIDRPVTTLTELGLPLSALHDLDRRLLGAMADLLCTYPSEGFSLYRHRWLAADIWAGAEVEISQVGRSITGINRGLDERGNLLLETPVGIQVFYGGEVSLRGRT